MNDPPAVVKFGDHFLFSDDFKLLAHGILETEIHSELEQVARRAKENKMDLAAINCFQLVIKGHIPSFQTCGRPSRVIEIGIKP